MHLLSPPSMHSLTIFLILFFTSILHTSTPVTALQLGSRDSPANILIAHARLQKRGNCCSQPDETGGPYGPPYPADPSVDQLKIDITSLGTVAGKRSIFYTSLGGQGGQTIVEGWACRDLDPTGNNFVIFRTLIPQVFIEQKLTHLASRPQSMDLWGKRASWAWAELAEGDTYIAVPTGVQPHPQSTWTLYEYPALQRNTRVTRIIRVDPTSGATSTIWTQGSPIDTPPPGPQHRSGPPIQP